MEVLEGSAQCAVRIFEVKPKTERSTEGQGCVARGVYESVLDVFAAHCFRGDLSGARVAFLSVVLEV